MGCIHRKSPPELGKLNGLLRAEGTLVGMDQPTGGSTRLPVGCSRRRERSPWERLRVCALRAMDPFTSAVLVLLICSPNSQPCRKVRHSEVYASLEACRAALPATLRKLNQLGPPAIGRCASVEGQEGIDPITRGSDRYDQYATVRVTRIENGAPATSLYRVPKS